MTPDPLPRARERPARILLVEDEIFIRMDVAKSGSHELRALVTDVNLKGATSGWTSPV